MAYSNKREDKAIRDRFRQIFNQKINESMHRGSSLIGGASGRGQHRMGHHGHSSHSMKNMVKNALKKRIKGSSIVGGEVMGGTYCGGQKGRKKTYRTRSKIRSRNKYSGSSIVGGSRKRANPWVKFFVDFKKKHPELKGKEAMRRAAAAYRRR